MSTSCKCFRYVKHLPIYDNFKGQTSSENSKKISRHLNGRMYNTLFFSDRGSCGHEINILPLYTCNLMTGLTGRETAELCTFILQLFTSTHGWDTYNYAVMVFYFQLRFLPYIVCTEQSIIIVQCNPVVGLPQRADGGYVVVGLPEMLAHVMDTSSLWLQLCEPQPMWGQLPMNGSDPLHCTSSSQMGPVPGPYLLPIVCPVNLTTTNSNRSILPINCTIFSPFYWLSVNFHHVISYSDKHPV